MIEASALAAAMVSEFAGAIGGPLSGRLDFRSGQPPRQPPLPAGRYDLPYEEGRPAVLVVPEGLDLNAPQALMVLFHGAGGAADKVLPFFVRWARTRRFLLLAPQSQYPTWDIVIGGHGPDRERLDRALAQVSDHFALDPSRLAFAGFSDGGSYALSMGLTNGDVASHVIGLCAGFMNTFQQNGSPRVFLAHGRSDSQLPLETSARKHAQRLLESGYDLSFFPFDGDHVIHPWAVERAIEFFLGQAS